jgi:hypothetical protein
VVTVTEIEVVAQPHADDVDASAPAARWAVEECAWKELVPALSDDVIALLAPPVVVCARATR